MLDIIISPYVPKDKIIIMNRDGSNKAILCESNYIQLIWSTEPDFYKALEIIKQHVIDKIMKRINYLAR